MNEGTIFGLSNNLGFVNTPQLEEIINRAQIYLNMGYPVHFRGPAGTGKTTLAMHIANRIGRPIVLIFGDEEFGTSDFIGGQFGLKKKIIIDNYISSVLRKEEDVKQQWIDGRVVTACINGYTLIYDEFTRSRPEVNNVFLPILEEGIIELPLNRQGEKYLKVHPEFKVIFTSNPTEYVGVYKSQDALKDRMITIDLDFPDINTEVEIVSARSGLDKSEAEKIVKIVRYYRSVKNQYHVPTMRSSISIAKIVIFRNIKINAEDEVFLQTCKDVLGKDVVREDEIRKIMNDENTSLIEKANTNGREGRRINLKSYIKKGEE